MAIITSQTVVTIDDALSVTTEASFTLQPENSGMNARRELSYPSDTLPPLIYDKNPDQWTNFDTSPLVKRPRVGIQQTIQDNRMTGWQGFDRDAPITEVWKGSDNESPMTLAFFRELYAYYETPPSSGYIQWSPKDRTNNSYNILIESLTVGGNEVRFDYIPARNGYLTQDVVLQFRIVSQV